MAARRSKGRSAPKKEPKARRAKKTKAAPAAIEDVEEVSGSGMGFEGAMVIATTVLLIGACALVWAAGY